MKTRTCPNCHYKYSLVEYLKKPFLNGIFSSWKCINCDAKLTVDESRRWILAFLGVVPGVFLPYLSKWFINEGFTALYSWILAILVIVLIQITIFSFEKFHLLDVKERTG